MRLIDIGINPEEKRHAIVLTLQEDCHEEYALK
jgi:hypothetical protein